MILLSTALFFPDYGSSGVPWDLLLLHFYFFAIAIPFLIIFNAARNSDRENPNRIKVVNIQIKEIFVLFLINICALLLIKIEAAGIAGIQ